MSTRSTLIVLFQKRLVLWDLVRSENEGDILIEVSDSVRQTLIADMDSTELLAAAEQLETDEIADIAPDLPEEVLKDLLENLDIQNRGRLQSALSYPEDSVGSLMEFEITTIREDLTLETWKIKEKTPTLQYMNLAEILQTLALLGLSMKPITMEIN